MTIKEKHEFVYYKFTKQDIYISTHDWFYKHDSTGVLWGIYKKSGLPLSTYELNSEKILLISLLYKILKNDDTR